MPVKPKILVVEDNRDVSEIVSEFLTAYGFRVKTALDGQLGLDLFRSEKPDLVLADVLLPKRNGFQICETIKNSDNPVPVILMSALYKTYNLQQQAKSKYGADEYMLKPLDLMDLARRICRLLDIERPSKEPDQADFSSKTDEVAIETPAEETPAAPCEQMPDSGDLAYLPIEMIIGSIVRSGRTGRMIITNDDIVRTVYHKDGVPIYVQSTAADETFVQLLIADEKITTAQLAEAESAAKENKSTVGKILIEQKAITSADLAAYLIKEVNHRMMVVLQLGEGKYEFVEESAFLRKIKRPEMDIFDLVYQAVCQFVSKQRLAARFERRVDMAVVKNEDLLHLAGRIAWDQRYLDAFIMIDGERTVQHLIAAADQPLDVWQLLYTLEIFDIVRFH